MILRSPLIYILHPSRVVMNIQLRLLATPYVIATILVVHGVRRRCDSKDAGTCQLATLEGVYGAVDSPNARTRKCWHESKSRSKVRAYDQRFAQLTAFINVPSMMDSGTLT